MSKFIWQQTIQNKYETQYEFSQVKDEEKSFFTNSAITDADQHDPRKIKLKLHNKSNRSQIYPASMILSVNQVEFKLVQCQQPIPKNIIQESNA